MNTKSVNKVQKIYMFEERRTLKTNWTAKRSWREVAEIWLAVGLTDGSQSETIEAPKK